MKWNLKKVKVSDLKENPKNPRKLTEKGLKDLEKSITKFGVAEPLVCNTDFMLCGGHGRKKILERLNIKEVDCYFPEKKLTEKQFDELGVRLNKNIAGEFDFDILANEFEVDELIEWGFDEKELDLNLWNDTDESKLDEVPEVPKVAVSKLGDLFLLDGKHRVMCGDSLDTEKMNVLMNNNKAEISFFSPPYNAGKTPTELKMNKESKYANDEDSKTKADYLQFITDLTNNSLLFSEYSFVNVQSISGNKTALIEYLYNLKDVYSDSLIWDKQTSQPAMAENVLNSQFEYIHCFSYKANRHIGTKKFRGTLSNVLYISKQTQNKEKNHNATFPVNFACYFTSNFCNESVLDLCIGSGSTLIACEQTKRICFGMELDPIYIDVILKRYKRLYPEAKFECLNRKYDFNKLFTE
jgi:DNA modification methylase